MKKIEGTATISIETLDGLREREKWFSDLRRDVKRLVERIDTEEYSKREKQIDDMSDMTDEEFERLIKEAQKTIRIIVSEKALRKLIYDFIDGEKSDCHYAIQEMTTEEFAGIPLILESLQRMEQTGGQQDRSVCEMCEAYMADAECDMKEECPAAGIVKRLKEAEETIKAKEKIIKERDKTIRELKKNLSDSELKRSYMVDPMAIGDRHEMGG